MAVMACWFLIGIIFTFLIQDSNQLTFRFRRRREKQTLKMVFKATSLDCRSERFLANFALQDTQCFLPSFKSAGLTVQEKNQIRFSRQQPWQSSWISDQNEFCYFSSTSHPNATYHVLSQLAFWFRRRIKNIDFSDGGRLGFLIGTILAIFDLQITRRFLPSFKSVGLSVQGKKRKNRFSRWRPWRPSQISDRKDLSYFSYSRHFKASYQVSSQSTQ